MYLFLYTLESTFHSLLRFNQKITIQCCIICCFSLCLAKCDVPAADKGLSRRHTTRPSLWKRNVQKYKKERGETYISPTGKYVAGQPFEKLLLRRLSQKVQWESCRRGTKENIPEMPRRNRSTESSPMWFDSRSSENTKVATKGWEKAEENLQGAIFFRK